MNIATIVLVYVVIWWMVFFAALPIGVRSQHESEEGVVEGTEPGAPSNPNLLKKALYTTLIAAVLTTGYYFLVDSGVISFRAPR
ncbi:DUF1467 family protein [Kordiimonas sp. SCSIO 12610]|uniref:DUF1467 family protein n=1 Tax=Kordiimonas sp. SCSIO 12610 TaxID=2829597 RepID=UPI00210C9369|nr:DUF1467 family protein [Kordiimonas sp. SCSIO 12610]UTW54062.1 DUF1467 family protein [Kordiimonas sp. SCSIO 12610]